jgi:hypothetical protein
MKLGTLFLLRSADLYLKEGGTIAFVLPCSIFSADQHDALRQGTFKGVRLTWSEFWDLEGVEPLFNAPPCVLFGGKTLFPFSVKELKGESLSGHLPRRNTSLHKAKATLKVEEVQFFLDRRGKRFFWGRGRSRVLMTLSAPTRNGSSRGDYRPSCLLVCGDCVPSSLGFDPNLPPLMTSRRAQKQAKDAYRASFSRAMWKVASSTPLCSPPIPCFSVTWTTSWWCRLSNRWETITDCSPLISPGRTVT